MVWCVITSDIRYIFNISPPRMLRMFHRHVADDMVAYYVFSVMMLLMVSVMMLMLLVLLMMVLTKYMHYQGEYFSK